MNAYDPSFGKRLRIIHCFRSPIGGIFRHVRDLIDEQIRQGHELGIICDNNTGGDFEEALFDKLKPSLELGLHRLPMHRSIGPRDGMVMFRLYREMRNLDVDVFHAHGSKGGAYARLIATLLRRNGQHPARIYCPHGGSVHYDKSTLGGRLYLGLERFLERFTDRLIFVSNYEQEGYCEKVREPACPYSLIHNGVKTSEFAAVHDAPDARDFVYVGMMRDLKGVDLFLNALPIVAQRTGSPISAILFGDGPDLVSYRERAKAFDASINVEFRDPTPAREAFAMGKTLVIPSRAESMPYVVLEALAAQRPVIATHAGGIPEIFGPYASALIQPGSLEALVSALTGRYENTRAMPSHVKLAERIREGFSVPVMANGVTAAYHATLANEPA